MTTSAPHSASSRNRIGVVLGRVASGVFVLAVGDRQGRETGILASWLQPAAFDPPMITVAVNRERWFTGWLTEYPKLALSILAPAQKHLVKHFGKGFAPDVPAFEGLQLARGVT